jgi:hypothetical protein
VQSSATSADHSDVDHTHGARSVDPLQARVDAAAFAVLREGRNPTVSLVRARMGGGSPNVVAPALQRWRLTFAGQLDENAGSALEVLPPGVLELVQALWSRALFEAHRVRADARSTANALEQLNEAIHALRDRTARLEEREAALDAELRALDQQRRRLADAESALRRRPAVGAKAWVRRTASRRHGSPSASVKPATKPLQKRSKSAIPVKRRPGAPRTVATRRSRTRRTAPQR